MSFNLVQNRPTFIGVVALFLSVFQLPSAIGEQWDGEFYQPLDPAKELANEPSYGDETFTPPLERLVLGPWARGLSVSADMSPGTTHLRGTRFYGQTLTRASFAGCDLTGVRFYQCDLANANFRGASLTGASIEECNITNAEFTDATVNGLRGDRLSEKQFKSTRSYKTKNFFHCKLVSDMVEVEDGVFKEGAPATYDLRGASLHGAFLGGDLRGCDFTNVWLSGSRFEGVRVTSTQLASTADFKRGSITAAYLDLAIEGGVLDLSAKGITDTTLVCRDNKVVLTDAAIERCTLHFRMGSEQLYSTKSYQQGRLLGLRWYNVDMMRWKFSRMNLTGSEFLDCKFTGAQFEDAVITDAHFFGSTGLTVAQIQSTWNYKHGRMAGVILPKEIAEALQKEVHPAGGTGD